MNVVKTKNEWYTEIARAIMDDPEPFYTQFYNTEIIRMGKVTRIDPCPMCGHRGCADFKENYVTCRSTGCDWGGTHITALFQYGKSRDIAKRPMIDKIAKFYNLPYPESKNADDRIYEERRERYSEIKDIATFFYHQQLMNCKEKFKNSRTKSPTTPKDYLIHGRGHFESTIQAFKVGFANNFDKLKTLLLAQGFSEQEIKEADIFIPEGLLIYPQISLFTGNTVRLNTKNPFGVEAVNDKGDKYEIHGFSAGNKILGYAPGFTYKKPIVVVEGEDDAQSLWESSLNNDGTIDISVAWVAGNVDDDVFRTLRGAKQGIYGMFDEDHAGHAYMARLNDLLPEKDVFRIEYSTGGFNDPDDYYKKAPNPRPIRELISEAKRLETDLYRIHYDNRLWTIENRHRRLQFNLTQKDKQGRYIGDATIHEVDPKNDHKWVNKGARSHAAITGLTKQFQPLNFQLQEAMEGHYDKNIAQKSFDELIAIFAFSNERKLIIKEIAKAMSAASAKESDEMAISITSALGHDVRDEVLKEVNDIQNQNLGGNIGPYPEMRLSQHFNITNDDAYFYFTFMKYDGDSVRQLPYLLRNDGITLRLDLYRRKDEQCILLIDNKYQLPEEVTNAKITLNECSLVQEWVEKFSNREVTDDDLSPYILVKYIEEFIRKCYFHKDENISKIIAMWIYGTYFYEMFGQYPYLFINGQKGTGKTILDGIIHMFGLNAKLAVDISEAAMYRMISSEGGVMILDEIENLTSRAKANESLMATLLKGGYQRGAKAYRHDMDLNKSVGYDIYSPKVISNIFGLEDVIEDRCVRIYTQKYNPSKDVKLEDPKKWSAERMPEIRAVTSRMCLSALTHFQVLNHIYDGSIMATDNARLTQILTPILAVAKMIDISKEYPGLKDITDDIINETEGEYVKSFRRYYETAIVDTKKEIEQNTPEGVLKIIMMGIVCEFTDGKEKKDYTDPDLHKYKEPLIFDEEDQSIIINSLHIKVFMEEHLHRTLKPHYVTRLLKTAFPSSTSQRKMMPLGDSSEELIREFEGAMHVKVAVFKVKIEDIMPSTAQDIFIRKSSATAGYTVAPKAPF